MPSDLNNKIILKNMLKSPEQFNNYSKNENQEQDKSIRDEFYEILEKGRKREKEGEKKQLSDELRTGLIKSTSNYFKKMLFEIDNPDKILSDSEKENIFNETKNKIAELKNKFSDQFRKTLLIQHEILQVFNNVVKAEALRSFSLEDHNNISKGLEMMIGFLELPTRLKWNMYEIINNGIKARVEKDQINNVLEIYKNNFKDKKLWEEIELAQNANPEKAKKIKLQALDRMRKH